MSADFLRIWRLTGNGNAVLGFKNIIIKFYSRNDSSLIKYDCLRSLLPSNIRSEILETMLSRVEINDDVVIITPEGIPFSPIDDEHTEMFAELLKKLHHVPLPDIVPVELANSMLHEGKYDPLRIWDKFYQPTVNSLDVYKKYIISRIFNQLYTKIKTFVTPTLIHGDMHYGNIIYLNGKLQLIDWSNARIDTPLIDLANFLISTKFNLQRTKMFLFKYNCELDIDDLLLPIFFTILWTILYLKDNKTYLSGSLFWCSQIELFRPLLILFES